MFQHLIWVHVFKIVHVVDSISKGITSRTAFTVLVGELRLVCEPIGSLSLRVFQDVSMEAFHHGSLFWKLNQVP